MYCNNCGTQNEKTSQFCKNCGTALPGSPQGTQAAANTSKNADTLMKFLKKRWMIIVPALAVLLLILNINGIMMKLSPAYAVGKAFDNTVKALDKRIEESPLKIFDILSDSVKNGTIGIDFDYYDAYGSEGSGKISVLTKHADAKYALIADLDIEGWNEQLEAYINSERLAFTASFLDNKYYGVKFKSFDKDLEKFADNVYIDEMTKESLKQVNEYIQSIVNSKGNSVLNKYYKLIKQFYKSLDAKKEKAKIELNGKEVSCTAVRYNISKDELIELFEDICKQLSKDEEMKALYSSLFTMQYPSYSMYYYQSPEEAYDEMISAFEDAIDEMKAEYTGDIVISFYIAGSKLAQIELAGNPAMYGDEIDVRAALNFGKNSEKDDISFDFEVYDSTLISFLNITYKTSDDSEDNINKLKIEYGDNYYTQSSELRMEWSKDSGDLRIVLKDGYSDTRLNANLKLAKDEFKLEFDDIAGYSMSGVRVDIAVSCKPGAKFKDPSFTNMDKWDEDFIRELENIGTY